MKKEIRVFMKLFCTLSKIQVFWKLGHETPIETGLRWLSNLTIKE